jgi:hypothetical protein
VDILAIDIGGFRLWEAPYHTPSAAAQRQS